ncbi:MAG: hypothetical protein HYV16_00200 [Gammaproteobacteria bacterium]|nr:hypothetical protein [Gammaproteobacteria bacterium]
MNKTLAIALAALLPSLAQAELTPQVQHLQTRWAEVKYQLPEQDQEKAFEALVAEAKNLVDAHPGQPEALIWKAIIQASYAGARGGLGALSQVEEAKASLEAAEKLDAQALNGSVYTSLGSLYYQVPGWPIGFGDEDKARDYLKKALELNPEGIDPNYFYADFLVEERDYKDALTYLQKAKAAPPRPGRELADQGRQKEIDSLLAKVNKKLKRK